MPKIRLEELDKYKEEENFKKIKSKQKSEKDFYKEVDKEEK